MWTRSGFELLAGAAALLMLIVVFGAIDGSSDTEIDQIGTRHAAAQRMLSQRLSKAALNYVRVADGPDRMRVRGELVEVATRWERVQLGLRSGDRELDIPPARDPGLRKMLSDVQGPHLSMLEAADRILQVPVGSAAASHALSDLMAAEPAYLDGMDRVVHAWSAHVIDVQRQARRARLAAIAAFAFVAFLVARSTRALHLDRASAGSQRDQLAAQVRAAMASEDRIRARVRAVIDGLDGIHGDLVSEAPDPAVRRRAGLARAAAAMLSELGQTQDEPDEERSYRLGFSLGPMMSDVLGVVSRTEAGSRIDWHLDLDPELPGEVAGDAGRLKEALYLAFRDVALSRPGGWLVVQVRSEGDGVVGFWWAADGSRSQGPMHASGAALEQLELIGGSLADVVDRDDGTRWGGVVVPLLALTPGRSECPALPGLRVLVLDSRPFVGALMDRMLRRWGVVARTVSDVDSAIAAFTEDGSCSWDVVLADDGPGGMAASLVSRLRGVRAARDVATVLLRRGGRAERSPDLGNVSRLERPFHPRALWSTLSRVHARRAEEVRPTPTTPRSGARVLVVEDNPVNVMVIRGHLEALGCSVQVAANGREGLDQALRDSFDVIFMDCMMPVMDGFEATRRLRAWERGAGLRQRIVAVTANAMPGDRERCIEAGMDDYLAKPISADDLKRFVDPSTVA